jgi:hypothetical protein
MLFHGVMLRLLFVLLSLFAAPAMAQPHAIPIPAHPREQAANGIDFDAPETPQRVLRGIGGTASGTATIGTHPAAREDFLRRVPEFLARVMPAR